MATKIFLESLDMFTLVNAYYKKIERLQLYEDEQELQKILAEFNRRDLIEFLADS